MNLNSVNIRVAAEWLDREVMTVVMQNEKCFVTENDERPFTPENEECVCEDVKRIPREGRKRF